jgi:hypothetical protein
VNGASNEGQIHHELHLHCTRVQCDNRVSMSVRWVNQTYTETEKTSTPTTLGARCEHHPTAAGWSPNVGSEDGKAVSREPDATTPLSKRPRSTQVKVC